MSPGGFDILAYTELKQKDSLLPVLEQAFWWPFNPAEYDRRTKTDSRLRDGSVGFCALRDGMVVGFVGVMDFTLRTASGKGERVGGIYAVATHPEYTRRGISTALLDRSHEYFMAKGYRFSILTTSPTIVAHGLYARLGYFDVAPFISAYLGARPKARKAPRPRGSARPDFSRMLELFRQSVKGKTGFAIREEEYLRTLFKLYAISAKDCVLTERGYLIFKKEKDCIRIAELVAQNDKEVLKLIELVEGLTKKPIVGRLGIPGSGDLIRAYRSRGFTVLDNGHGVLMAKELVVGASFKDCFGDRFCMSILDHF